MIVQNPKSITVLRTAQQYDRFRSQSITGRLALITAPITRPPKKHWWLPRDRVNLPAANCQVQFDNDDVSFLITTIGPVDYFLKMLVATIAAFVGADIGTALFLNAHWLAWYLLGMTPLRLFGGTMCWAIAFICATSVISMVMELRRYRQWKAELRQLKIEC